MNRAHGLVIVSDMDGTLLNRDGKVSCENREAIEFFNAEGGRFTLASGRYGKDLESLFPGYEKYINAPVILCNGALLCNVQTGEIIREVKGRTDELFPVLQDISERFPELEIKTIVKTCGGYESVEWQDVCCEEYYCKVVTRGEPELLDRVREYSGITYSDHWAQSKSCPHLLEFLLPEGTKGQTLAYLRRYLEKEDGKATVIAVGDYENDLDMLMAADIAACPMNAVDRIKRISKIHLCDHHNGCIADLVERILNKKINIRDTD